MVKTQPPKKRKSPDVKSSTAKRPKHLARINSNSTHPMVGMRWEQYVANIAAGVMGRDKGQLNANVRDYAHLIDAAYKYGELGGVSNSEEYNTELARILKRTSEQTYTLESDYSTPLVSVFHIPDTNQYIHAIPGTHTAEDVKTDAALAVGLLDLTHRYEQQKEQFQNFLSAHPDAENIVVGHSLGGTLAEELARDYDAQISQVHSLNPGSSPLHARKSLRGRLHTPSGSEKVFQYHVSSDPISMFTRGNENVTLLEPLKGSKNPHSLQQYLR